MLLPMGLKGMDVKLLQDDKSVQSEEELLANVPAENEISQILGRKLWFASMNGDEQKVKELLTNQSTDVNYRLPYAAMKFSSFTPLMIAVTFGRPGVVTLLLADARTNVMLVNNNDRNAFHCAVRMPGCLKLFLARYKAGTLTPSLDVSAAGFGGRTPLHEAFEDGEWPSAYALSATDGVDPNVFAGGCNLRPLDALKCASRTNFDKPVEEQNEHSGNHAMLCQTFFNLVEKGLCVEAKGKDDESPFSRCLDGQHMGCVIWPLICIFGGVPSLVEAEEILTVGPSDAGKPQDALSRYLLTILPDKSLDEATELVIVQSAINLFLSNNVDLMGSDSFGLTPCMILAGEGEAGIFDLYPRLLEADVINVPTWNGWRAIHFAAYNGRLGMFQLLLSLPQVDVFARTDSGLDIWDLAQLGHNARMKANGESDDSALKLLNDFHNRCIMVFKTLRIAANRGLLAQLPDELLIGVMKAYRYDTKTGADNNDNVGV